ncbi:MAG: hypothetical protein AAF531_04180 [Actinomycetota bacterium]
MDASGDRSRQGDQAPDRVGPSDPVGLRSARRFVPVLVVFLVLFGGYQLLLRTVLSPAVYSENPAQSSLINVQGALYADQRDVAIVGSSISARFLSGFFDERGVPVTGLALDAQGPALGIDLLADAERIPATVAVEINRALYSSSDNEQTILDTVDSTGFDLARPLPGLRAESRPSSVLYTELKQRRDGTGSADAGDGLTPLVYTVDLDPGFDPAMLTEEQREGSARVREALDQVRAAGACIVFYIAPDQGFAGPAEQAFVEDLSFTYGSPVVDLRELERQTTLGYTDHIHLDIPSARLVSHVLADTLSALGDGGSTGTGGC